MHTEYRIIIRERQKGGFSAEFRPKLPQEVGDVARVAADTSEGLRDRVEECMSRRPLGEQDDSVRYRQILQLGGNAKMRYCLPYISKDH